MPVCQQKRKHYRKWTWKYISVFTLDLMNTEETEGAHRNVTHIYRLVYVL